MNLEGVDIFQAETIRRAAKIPAELRYRVEVRLLRRRRQIADRHVLDHAAAKRADLSHRKTSCLKGWAFENPQSSQTGGDSCDRSLTAASAASFNRQRASLKFLRSARRLWTPRVLRQAPVDSFERSPVMMPLVLMLILP